MTTSTYIEKIGSWLTSTKAVIIQAGVFFGAAVVILYLIHIEHLPNLSILESITTIAGLGAFSAVVFIVFGGLTTIPVAMLAVLNMEVSGHDKIPLVSARWGAIITSELMVVISGHSFFFFSLILKKDSIWLFSAIFCGIISALFLCREVNRFSLKAEAITYSVFAFLLSVLYSIVYILVTTVTGKKDIVMGGVFAIAASTTITLATRFIKGKNGLFALSLSLLFFPLIFTADLKSHYLLPKAIVKIARKGSFFAERVILDKKGCQIVSANPIHECVADVYPVCAVYVDSRLGDPNLIHVLRYDHTGRANTKVYEIPSTSVLGMTMDQEQPLLEGSDIDSQLMNLAKRCITADRFVIDGLFALNQKDLDENGRRRVLDALGGLLTSGEQPPLRILGYADESGSARENRELSNKRAETVRDFLVSKGYPVMLINLSSEGDSKPIQHCKKTSVQGKYDCGRVNRRVEIEVHNY